MQTKFRLLLKEVKSKNLLAEPLTHFRLNKHPPHYLLEESNFNVRYVKLCDLDVLSEKWLSYLHFVVSDLALHCLPVALLGVSRLKWVKIRQTDSK